MIDLAPEWSEIIKAFIAKGLDGLHTSVPAKVVSYNRNEQTCIIDTASKDLPRLEDIPVHFPRGGGGFIHFDLAAGDGGLIIFSEIDFSHWRALGLSGEPNLLVRHGLYGIFSPGLSDDLHPLTPLPGMTLGTSTGAIVKCGMTINVQALSVANPTMPAVPLIRKDIFDLYCQTLETALDGVVPGSGTSLSAIRGTIGTLSLKAE